MKCPNHHKKMVVKKTRRDMVYECPVEGCDVLCWNSPTSRPGDAETRSLRHQCHLEFDPLWNGKGQFRDQNQAYAWLSKFMGLPRDEAHIGMFSKEQCLKLLTELRRCARSRRL